MSPSGPGLRISVVVLAYRRTEYLAGALRSIFAQGFPAERLEVLVVANELDDAVRAEFEPRGVRFRRSSQEALGAKVAEGARAAQGEILCLLEDDDRFLPGKLAGVARRFENEPDLTYYHNGFRTIGPTGDPWPGRFAKDSAARAIARRQRVHRPAGGTPGSWSDFAGVFPGFNNSCISLRREPFGPWWEYVARSGLGSDECLFLAGAATDGAMLQDAEVLTGIMVHPGSISNPVSGASGIDLERLRSFSEQNAESRKVLVELARASGRADLLELAEAEVATQQLVGCLRDASSRPKDFRGPLRVVLERPHSLAARNFRSVTLLGVVGSAAPFLARGLYRRFKRIGA